MLNVSPGQVVLRVLASYEGPGEPYVRVIEVESGAHLGDFDLGDITLSIGPGDHRLFIFVEVDQGGRTIQCDGSVSFTVPVIPPPPPPPPVCEPTDRPDLEEGGQCSWDKKACEWQCQECDEINPPRHTDIVTSSNSRTLGAGVDVSGNAKWNLRLYAGNPNSPRRFLKAQDSVESSCGEAWRLTIGYFHANHGSCLWTAVLFQDGNEVAQEVILNRCDVN